MGLIEIIMRLDKFLKVSRIIKRRTVAAEAADKGKVIVNGKEAKPSHRLKVGDVIELTFGSNTLKVRVKQLLEHTKKDEHTYMYEVC